MTFGPADILRDPDANPGRRQSQVPFARFTQWIGVKGLEPGDFFYLGFLMAAGIWIWVRDTAWLSTAEETLPILVALPLFVWLGSPWRLRQSPGSLRRGPLMAAALLAGAGLAMDMTLLLAGAWTFALWIWVQERVTGEAGLRCRLAILPLMAFPWVALDLMPVGWGVRISAAWVADQVYGAVGFSVAREGTNLLVSGIPIEVAAPCSGMNSLQAILMGGLVLTWIEFGRTRWYWWIVASLPLVAWVANTVRVCSVIAMAVGWGPEVARGSLHQICGWAVIASVFGGWLLATRWVTGARRSSEAAAWRQPGPPNGLLHAEFPKNA